MNEPNEGGKSSALQNLNLKIGDLKGKGWKGLDVDFYLLEWLKAKKMSVKKTEKAIRKAYRWRVENGIMDPIEDFPEDLSFRLPISQDLLSRNGIPVYAVALKNWRIQSLVQLEGLERVIRYVNLFALKTENRWIQFNSQNNSGENMEANMTKYFSCVVDAKDFSTTQIIPENMQKKLTRDAMKYFPPLFRQVVLINVPSRLLAVQEVLKRKPKFDFDVKYFTEDDTKWKKCVSDILPLDNLPRGFGGL